MDASVLNLIESAQDIGVRLEAVNGIHFWEAMPGRLHHNALMAVRDRFISSGDRETFTYVGLLIGFPDGSFKTPDMSIFCEDPTEETDAVTRVPEAVVEILSPGYEKKDLEIGPPFYLSQGVLDVVVVDPKSGAVKHFTTAGVRTEQAPCTIALQCGCPLPIHLPS